MYNTCMCTVGRIKQNRWIKDIMNSENSNVQIAKIKLRISSLHPKFVDIKKTKLTCL